MFSPGKQLELRRIIISSLVTCIYLPCITTWISSMELLYDVGNGSSFYILVIIFAAELCKSLYLNSSNVIIHGKNKSKSRLGDILKSFGFLLGVMFSFFVGIILFGAPVMESHEQTLMLSALLTLLTIFPMIAYAGVETSMQLLFGVKSYSKDTIEEMLVNNALFTVCGAWLGAVVIPLDWNTPWQQWPIPCYLGAVGGFLLCNILTISKVSLMTAADKYPKLNIIVSILNKFRISSK